MKYLSTLLFFILLVCSTTAYAGSTQTNVSGSNTAIEGGYTGGATTYESGSSSSSTTNNTSNSDIRSAPPSAGAPSYNSMTQDVCAVGASAGLQTFGINTEVIEGVNNVRFGVITTNRDDSFLLNTLGIGTAVRSLRWQNVSAGSNCGKYGYEYSGTGTQAGDLWIR